MSGDVGYLIVTGTVWAALIFLLMLAVIGLLRSRERARRHHRRHHLARLRAAMQEAPSPALPPPEEPAAPPTAPHSGPVEPGSPSTRHSRPPAVAPEERSVPPATSAAGRQAGAEARGEDGEAGATPAAPA